ncbi:energy transducer TonB [Aquimarina brevivitae]|uniref:Outer membrane transport energization protein TonB n=1 Tax=Aquimarina brevivitae TaxID=323412 RepID=A0A4Q7NYC5_9FLAO|nr:outer membrane transport energization protein TonB [Aquimarina brevivitae]
MLTTIIHAVIVLLLLYLGVTYLDPPPERGIAVNFGNSITGSGTIQPNELVKTTPKQTTPEETPSEPQESSEVAELEEELVTQDNEEAPVIDKKPNKEPVEKTEKPEKQKEATETKKEVTPTDKKVEEKKPDPKPDKSTLDILDSFANGPETDGNAKKGGEGNDTSSGDKGNPDGDPYATSYYGQPGPGGSGGVGYGLNGRGRPTNSKVVQECNESGRVVVKIVVDRSGKVIQATPGVKGTTNNASCLLDPAKRTALTFRWKPDPNAPERQIGFVEVTFGLGE